jgi:hypothetical protein
MFKNMSSKHNTEILDGESPRCVRCYSIFNNVKLLAARNGDCSLRAIYSYCNLLSGAPIKATCCGIVHKAG